MKKNKILKGDYGYIRKKQFTYSVISLIFIALIAGFFIAGKIKYGTNRNYFSIVAVLICLPFAKYMVLLITSFRFKSIKKDKIGEIMESLKAYGDYIIYDLLVTLYDEYISINAAFASEDCLFIYSYNCKKEEEKREKLSKNLKDKGYISKVFITSDFSEFLKRLEHNSPITKNNQRMDYLKIISI